MGTNLADVASESDGQRVQAAEGELLAKVTNFKAVLELILIRRERRLSFKLWSDT